MQNSAYFKKRAGPKQTFEISSMAIWKMQIKIEKNSRSTLSRPILTFLTIFDQERAKGVKSEAIHTSFVWDTLCLERSRRRAVCTAIIEKILKAVRKCVTQNKRTAVKYSLWAVFANFSADKIIFVSLRRIQSLTSFFKDREKLFSQLCSWVYCASITDKRLRHYSIWTCRCILGTTKRVGLTTLSLSSHTCPASTILDSLKSHLQVRF